MKQKEMIRTVTAEYNRIIETGEFHGIKNKRVHTNKNLPRYRRSRIANKVNGKLRKDYSINAIQIVFDELKMLGIKPTIKAVAEILEGRRGIATIKKYWRIINPKIAVVDVETSIEHIQLTPPKEGPIAAENVPQAPSFLSRDEFYQKNNSAFVTLGDLHWKYVKYRLESKQRQNTSQINHAAI